MAGWLVNDQLTCIPNTKTFWHHLLEWIPDLVDKTGGYTSFAQLPDVIEVQAESNPPDYIIRNASYFRPLRLDIPTVSLLQDPIVDAQQIQVCKDSDLVITNSPYTEHILRSYVPSATSQMIPLGVDFDFFKPCPVKTQMDILPNSILFVGAANPFKGFELLKQLIDTTNYNFCLVVKDDTTIEHKRCRVYNRVGQEEIRDIYNSCSMLICLSSIETQHLATIEAGACGIPVVTTNVGINYNYPSGPWGENVDSYAPSKIREAINLVMNNLDKYNPRHILLDRGLHTPACKKQWVKLCKKY